MIAELLPEGIRVAVDPGGPTPDPLHPEEAALAAAMGPRRRAEFARGRSCARRALVALGRPAEPVLRAARRAPRWPTGIVGAITHTEGYCAAAAGPSQHWAGIGVDVEQRKPLSTRALERICSASERQALEALADCSPEAWGNVVFSAKETLYKAYFPKTEVFLGFRDAEIHLDPPEGRFEIALARADVPDLAGRRRFEGRFAIGETHVFTALAVAAR